MEWLRWILLALGAGLIGSIYWSGRRQASGDRDGAIGYREDGAVADAPAPPPQEPPLHPAPSNGDAVAEAPPESIAPRPTDPSAVGMDKAEANPAPEEPMARQRDPDERLVTLYIAAAPGERLVGPQLATAFARCGLEHGELGIFHARENGTTLFSVANGVEPGTFDPTTMDVLSTPGLVMLLRLPVPAATAESAFERMVATARELAENLGARLLDENHATLTPQTEQYLRDELRRLEPGRGSER